MNDTEAQWKQVLKFLQSGRTLTSREAQRLFGVDRLSARIHDIKKHTEHKPKTDMIATLTGKRVAQYRLIKET